MCSGSDELHVTNVGITLLWRNRCNMTNLLSNRWHKMNDRVFFVFCFFKRQHSYDNILIKSSERVHFSILCHYVTEAVSCTFDLLFLSQSLLQHSTSFLDIACCIDIVWPYCQRFTCPACVPFTHTHTHWPSAFICRISIASEQSYYTLLAGKCCSLMCIDQKYDLISSGATAAHYLRLIIRLSGDETLSKDGCEREFQELHH